MKATENINKPRIAMINTCTTWGGGEKWHFDTACFLHSQGYPLLFICQRDSALHQRLVQYNIPHRCLRISNRSFLNPFKILRLRTLLHSSDIVIVNSPADNKITGIASKLNASIRVVFRRGMPHPIRKSLLNRYLFRYCIDHVIANSKAVKDSLTASNKLRLHPQTVSVIHNGIDVDEYDNRVYSPYYTKRPGQLVLVNCGRLVKQKNQSLLLKVAEQLKQRSINFMLLIVGDGELKDTLAYGIAEKNLGDCCRLVGFTSNIKDVLSCADVFLFPSLYEGSSNALIEACGAGLPILASDIAPNRELVTDYINGRLLPIDDERAWVDAIIELTHTPNQLVAWGEQSRQRVKDEFSLASARTLLLERLEALAKGKTL